MSIGRSPPPERVPTLTEVLVMPLPSQVGQELTLRDVTVEEHREPAIDEHRVRERVLADLQRQLDALVESRLREAMGLALAHAGDALISDLHERLAATLHTLVVDAVEQEVARYRHIRPHD